MLGGGQWVTGYELFFYEPPPPRPSPNPHGLVPFTDHSLRRSVSSLIPNLPSDTSKSLTCIRSLRPPPASSPHPIPSRPPNTSLSLISWQQTKGCASGRGPLQRPGPGAAGSDSLPMVALPVTRPSRRLFP